jgi:hypothetical protein
MWGKGAAAGLATARREALGSRSFLATIEGMALRLDAPPSLASVAILAALTSCTASTNPAPSGPKPNERIGDIRTNDVWKDGYRLVGLVRIMPGATVEIEPGARISCLASAQVQIGGTLHVDSAAKHASISCEQWVGLLVANGGTLDMTGLDLENADVGIETTPGAASATVSESNITTTTRPFLVREKSSLTVTKVHATTPTTLREADVSVSEVYGTLTAKYLDYSANTNEGIMVQRGGSADIQDSTLHAENGLDTLSSYGGTSLKVSYTTMTGAHCGVHVAESKDSDKVPTGSITVDHISSDNLYGITIYAASTQGPHVVKDSNLKGAHSWIDLQGNHGPITFQNVFTEGGTTILCDGRECPPTDIPVFGKATARIPGAQPR